MFTILLSISILSAFTLSDQQFVGTVLKVEKDTLVDFVNFEHSIENWNLVNMLTIDTGEDINNVYKIPKHYRYLAL